MKAWIITLAATVFLVIAASVYDLNGRISDEVQKIAARQHESPLSERAYFSRQLQHWTPDDCVGVLITYVPVGGLLAGGIAISFIVLAATQKQRDLSVLVFSAIGVIGCAAAVCGHEWRVQEFNKSEAAFAEWGRTTPATAEGVLRKDGFLAHLVMLKKSTLLLNVGLIATTFALGYGIVLAARRNSMSNDGTKPS